MGASRGKEDYRPQPTTLAQAVRWLRDRGVPVRAIADTFSVSEGNVRVLAHRGKQSRVSQTAIPPIVWRDFREDVEEGVLTHSRGRYVATLEERAQTIAAGVERDWNLSQSATAFRALLPHIGLPSSVELIRLNARIRKHLAWCLVHQGHALSALTEAVRATRLHKVAYRTSSDRSDLVGLGEVALIASNACLLRREPSRATRWLDLHHDAHGESGEHLNVEYFRQRGVAASQLGDWPMARQSFQRVGDAATDAEAPLWLHHARDRHLSLLESSDWELAASAMQGIQSVCAPDALQIVTATQWAIAAGIASDSPQANRWAAEMLSAQQQVAGRFAHQQTVSWLLGRTERLKLPDALRHQWVSRVLYANDSANR